MERYGASLARRFRQDTRRKGGSDGTHFDSLSGVKEEGETFSSSKTSGSFRNVRRLRAFLALGDFEFHLITFLQALVTFSRDGAVMDENIGSIFASDKTVTLGVVEPLHRTFHTFHLPPLTVTLDLGESRMCLDW